MIGCWANTWNLRERKLLGSLHYLSKSRMCLLYTKSLLQYRSINRFYLTSPISFTAHSFKLLAVWGILCRKSPFKLGQVDRRWAMSLSPRYVHICLTDFGISRPNMQLIFRYDLIQFFPYLVFSWSHVPLPSLISWYPFLTSHILGDQVAGFRPEPSWRISWKPKLPDLPPNRRIWSRSSEQLPISSSRISPVQ